MQVKINESEKWKQLIKDAPLPNDYSEEADQECESLQAWFRGLDESERLGVVVDHIRKGVRLYWFLQEYETFGHIYKDLLAMYVSPFRFSMEGLNEEQPTSLTYRQFSVLHAIMENGNCNLRVPLIRSPPEYWYLYQGARATLREIGKELPFNGEDVVLGKCDLKLGASKAVAFQDVLNVQDGSGWVAGVAKAPRFVLPNDSYRMSMHLYDAWPSYWNRFEEMRVHSFIGNKVSEAVCQIRNRDKTPLGAWLRIKQDSVNLITVEGNPAFSLIAAQTRVPVPYLTINAPIMPDSRPREMEAVACPCHRCGEEPIEDSIQIIGASNFVDAIVNIPICLNDAPSNIIGKQRMESSEEDKGTVQIGGIALCSDWMVAVNHRLWTSYLRVDAVLAKHASNTLYDRTLDDANIIRFDLNATLFKALGGVKVPRTFYKFAWLYWVMGLVTLDMYGKYPVGRQKPVENLRAIEFSGAPWGNMMALLEAGLVTSMTYTIFKGEASTEPLYKSTDRFGNKMTFDLLENYQGPTDIRSIAKAILAEKNSKRPLIDRTRFDHMVFDIPLHRNSAMAHSGKDHSKENKDRKFREFLDDLPLGKKQAMAEIIGCYSVLVDKLLKPGGTLVVKVLEFWDRSIIEVLYNLFITFRVVRIYKNPYSRPASKEVFFVGVGYESGVALRKDLFYGMCVKMASYCIANLSINLIRLAQRYGKEFLAVRQICCRMDLCSAPCLPFLGEAHDYIVPYAAAERPTVLDSRVVVRTPITEREVLIVAGDGYSPMEAECLLRYFGSVRRVRSAPVAVRQALIDIAPRVFEMNNGSFKGPEWAIDDETVDLVARMTNSSINEALLALVSHNGDIVDSISSLTAQY